MSRANDGVHLFYGRGECYTPVTPVSHVHVKVDVPTRGIVDEGGECGGAPRP